MAHGIGIDTGGTYTDAVVFDFETRKVQAKGKSPTTREDLSLGIGRALDMLPRQLLESAELVALSTTLATNACVENKGGRARLVLMGTERRTLERVGADRKYGLNYDDVLCLETKGSFDGTVVDHPDWEKVTQENDAFFREAEALSVAELNSLRNGAVCEIVARDALKEKYDVPLVMANELASDLNIMERGATALLNARLLPVVDQFMKAVTKAMHERGLDAPQVIVRSDGSLMVDELARQRPVETILSGPAASVMGCRALADCGDCLIVDMGGTTTDISIVRGGAPDMSGGISIGGWRTQIKGVFIDTFGLGGDTRVYMKDGALQLDTRRVEPLCSAARKWPQIKFGLEDLLPRMRPHTRQLHEFLYLVRMPESLERYNRAERKLIETLSAGPQMIGGNVLDPYGLDSERLENEGIVMRCGLTPTDIMHVRGDYGEFDAEVARLAARCFLQALPDYEDTQESMDALCEAVYTMVKRRMFENIARVFIEAAYPEIRRNGLDAQLKMIIERKWNRRNEQTENTFFDFGLNIAATLIGTGAPTHIFLPDVAKALGAKCVIPEHSEVANAVGAVVADVAAQASVDVRTNLEGLDGYTILSAGVREDFEEFEQAVDAASGIAKARAVEEARRRGALGELRVEVKVNTRKAHDRAGAELDLGTTVVARATGRMR